MVWKPFVRYQKSDALVFLLVSIKSCKISFYEGLLCKNFWVSNQEPQGKMANPCLSIDSHTPLH